MRILRVLVLIGLAIPALAQTGEVVLDIGSDEGGFGETVTVPITMSVTGTLPSTLVFRVSYDVLKLAYQSYTLGPNVPDDKIVSADVGITGITFVIYGGTSTIPAGRLMTLRFTVLAPDTSGRTVLTGANGSASTPQAVDIPVRFDEGSVQFGSSNVGSGCPGSKALAGAPSVAALPVAMHAGGTAQVRATDPVFIRLDSGDAIDPASVWASSKDEAMAVAAAWLPDTGDAARGWVRVTPVDAWPEAGTVTVTVGASTVAGAVVAPASHTVECVGDDAATVMKGMPGALATWEIGPQTVYDSPREVLLPLPANARDVSLFLFDGQYTWWDALAVDGWLARAPEVVKIDGVWHVRLRVRHGGVVAIGPATITDYADAGVLPAADIALVLAVAALLACWHVVVRPAAVRTSHRA